MPLHSGITPLGPIRAWRSEPSVKFVASWLRGGTSGFVDIDSITSKLNVVIEQAALGAPLEGVTLSDSLVVVRRRLGSLRRRFVIAHELAHVLARRGDAAWAEHDEMMADALARELLVPCRELRERSVTDVPELCRAYRAERITVLAQLSAAGRAPRVMLDHESGRVLCGSCGDRQGQRDCECRTARRRASTVASLGAGLVRTA